MMEPQSDQGRYFLAILLMMVVLLVWSWYMRSIQPPPSPPAAEELPVEEELAAPEKPQVAGPETVAVEAAEPSVGDVINEAPSQLVLETDLYRVVLDERGAQVRSWQLKEHDRIDDRGSRVRDENGQPLPVELVSPAAERLWERPGDDPGSTAAYPGFPLAVLLPAEDRTRRLNLAGFVCERTGGAPEAFGERPRDARVEAVCHLRSSELGVDVEKSLALAQGSYLVDLRIRVRDLAGQEISGAQVLWGPGMGQPSAAQQKDRYYFSGRVVASRVGEDIERDDRNSVKERRELPPGAGFMFAGLEEKYFAAVFLPAATGGRGVLPRGDAPVEVLPFDDEVVDAEGKLQRQRRLAVAVPVSGRGQPGEFRLFVGPKDTRVLAALERETGANLTGLIKWGFWWFLAVPLYRLMVWLHGFVGNYGVAIILITIVIKILFFPLTQKAMVNMRKTQEKMSTVQPKMKAIREKYRKKKDPEARKKMNQEMMALYQKEGINPMGGMAGCMPLLLQFPILLAMLSVLSNALELRGAPFVFWVRDLSLADPYYVTPLLMGGSMLAQQVMAMTRAKDPQQRQQQRMMLVLPFVFTIFFFNLPSGLVLYWLVNNLLGIGQQWLINRQAAAQVATAH